MYPVLVKIGRFELYSFGISLLFNQSFYCRLTEWKLLIQIIYYLGLYF